MTTRRLLSVVLLASACAGTGRSGAGAVVRPPRPAPPLSNAAAPEVLDEDTGAAESPAPEPAPPAGPAGGEDAALGWIAGEPLTARELLEEWYGIAPDELFLVLEKVVTGRLALAEARRLGMRLAPEAVEARLTAARARLAEEVAASGEDLSVDEYVRTRLGSSPDAYRERLRRATIRQMLAERAVRVGTLAGDWARVRLIAVPGEAELAEVRGALAAGGDFAELARTYSLDDSSEDGGLVPFLIRQPGSALSVATFAARPGELVGPFEVSGAQVLLRVEQLHTGRTGDWAVLGEEVEASLARHPVRDAEFLQWKRTVEGRYAIDVGPLRDLLGIDG